MSRLQERAKPFLVPLINGIWNIVSPPAMEALSAWATMFTMVVEFADPEMAGVSFETRSAFRLNNVPPEEWRIWIAPYKGISWKAKFFHTGVGVYYPPFPDEMPLVCNTQITTFSVGPIIFHTFSTTAPNISLTPDYERRLFISRIWPIDGQSLIGKPWTLNDTDADRVSTTLRKMFLDLPRHLS